MALSDYYLCDNCGKKCFYDANLNWEPCAFNDPEAVEGMGLKLDYCGAIVALCHTCTKTHEIVLVEKT